MHRFSCKTDTQRSPALLGVAQGNLAGSLKKEAENLAAAVLHVDACYFHFGI